MIRKQVPDADETQTAASAAPQVGEAAEPIVGASIGESEAEIYSQTLENVRKERDEYYDLLLRKQAEFDNYRKRTLREREEARLSAIAEVSKELLAVLDGCEKGLDAVDSHDPEMLLRGYREGYELLLRTLKSALEKYGVSEISALGAMFDPVVHEAVLTQRTSEHKPGMVLAEFRKGYRIGDRLIRPAQVIVAVESEQTPEASSEESAG
jgi:molecular chaperone GrpE